MENTNYTIHIFGYGETQINTNFSFKDSTDKFTNIAPLLEAIFAKKPASSTLIEKKYHAIHILNGNEIRWQVENGFSLQKNDIDDNIKLLVNNLIAELEEANNAAQLVEEEVKA